MRIVYVLTSLGIGGAEKQALALAKEMEKRGHAVALLVLSPQVREQWPTRIQTFHLNLTRSSFALAGAVAKARKFLRDFRPDVINSHSFHSNLFARILAGRIPRCAVVSTVHNVYEGGWVRMFLYRITDGLSRRTIAVSHAAAERFISVKAVPEEKSGVIANGIAIDDFAPDHQRRTQMRAQIGLDGRPEATPFIWLAVGRVVPAKDYPNLLRAFAILRVGHPDAQMWVAGETAGTVFSDCCALALQLRIDQAIRWLGLSRDIPGLLDSADAFVSSSAWEGMPLAVAEAMAMQKCIVATDVGGVRELLGEAGILVPPQNSQALASAMHSVMQQGSEEPSIRGRAARQRVIDQFSIDGCATAWEKLYRETAL